MWHILKKTPKGYLICLVQSEFPNIFHLNMTEKQKRQCSDVEWDRYVAVAPNDYCHNYEIRENDAPTIAELCEHCKNYGHDRKLGIICNRQMTTTRPDNLCDNFASKYKSY